MKDSDKNKYLLSSVNNSLRIMELFTVRDSLRLKEIAAELDLDKTSTFKMLYTLCYRGFLYKDEHARYHLGSKLTGLRQLSEIRSSIVEQASASIYKLRANTQKTILIGVPGSDDKLTVLYMKTERNQDSIYGRMGATMYLHTTGAGKVLISQMNEENRLSLIDRLEYPRLTENTITDKEVFAQVIADTCEQRWGIAIEENRKDHCDLAVPFYDYTGNCVGVIDLVTDLASMNASFNYYLEQLQIAARQISQKLGCNA